MKVAERWFVMAGIGLLGAIALAGLVVAVYAAWLFHDLPDASDLTDYRPPTATRVYAGDGTLIGEFSDERRIYVPYEQIPEPVIHAFMAAEDKNFFQHGGIDVSGIGRAMFKNVFNFVAGRRLERIASFSLRPMVDSLVSSTFLATCWVMVEPPSRRRPETRLNIFLNIARPKPETSIPPCEKKFLSSAARKAWITGVGIWS